MDAQALAMMAALVVGTSCLASIAEAQNCRTISDSLLRLRCYDDAARTTPANPLPSLFSPSQTLLPDRAPLPTPATQPPAAVAAPPPSIRPADFTAYPAPLYRGRLALPDFAGRDRNYRSLRTRIRDGAKAGPNFAGYVTLVQIGCGTNCSVVLAVDARTGEVFSFPGGGESDYSLDVAFRPNSRLLVAQWENVAPQEECVRAQFVLQGTRFERVNRQVIGPRAACN